MIPWHISHLVQHILAGCDLPFSGKHPTGARSRTFRSLAYEDFLSSMASSYNSLTMLVCNAHFEIGFYSTVQGHHRSGVITNGPWKTRRYRLFNSHCVASLHSTPTESTRPTESTLARSSLSTCLSVGNCWSSWNAWSRCVRKVGPCIVDRPCSRLKFRISTYIYMLFPIRISGTSGPTVHIGKSIDPITQAARICARPSA